MAEQNDTTTGTTTVTSDTSYFDPAPELTQDEYQSRFIDFYNMPTITDPVVIDDDDDDDDDDQDVQPNVLAPVGNDEDRQTIFGQGTVLGEGKSFTFETLDYNKVINDYVDPSKAIKGGAKKEKSLGEFGKAIADMYKTPEGAIGSGVGFMMGLGPLGGPALSAMAEVNRKKQKQTADAISATGGTGGAMFKLNNQTVYRAPGSTQYGGTYSGTSSQLLGMEAITNGFLPGTFRDTPKRTGPGGQYASNEYVKTGLPVAHADTDAMVVINANGNIVGLDGTMFSVSAGQATKARENHAKAMARAMGSNYTPTSAEALEIRQKGLAHMKATFNIGVLDRTSDLSKEESDKRAAEYNRYTSALMKQIIERQRKVSDDFSTGELGTDIGVGSEIPQGSSRPLGTDFVEGEAFGQSPEKSDGGGGRQDGPDRSSPDRGYREGPPGQSGPSGGDYGAGMQRDYAGGFDGPGMKSGGRVGYAPGGVARAAPAGFVERPPSQVSEAATVADDKPMSVPDGTFVINAAAVEFAGEKDIMDMLNVAYKKAEKKGIQPPSQEMLEVAVSRGEVIVPPFLAKIIGYDRLEKINNRGKKEVNERIKENGQQPVGASIGGFIAGPFEKKKTELTAADLEAQDYFSELEQSNPEQFAAIQQLDAELEESLLTIADRDPVFMAGLEGKQSISEFVAPVTGAITQEDKEAGAFSRATNPSSQAMNQPQGFVKMQTRGQGHPVAGVTYQQMDDVPYERVLIHEIMHKGADQIEKNRGAFKQLTDLITGKLGVHMVRKGRAEHKYINSVLNTVAMRRGADVDELTQAVRRSFLTYMDRDEREQALLNNEGISVQTKENNRGKRTDRLRIETKDPEVLKQILTNLNEIMMQDVVAKRLATRAQQHSSATR